MGIENLPTPGKFVTNRVVNTFRTTINQLISDMGKKVTLHLRPKTTDCPNCQYDRQRKRSSRRFTPGGPQPFPNGAPCPWCDDKGKLYERRTIQFTALLEDFQMQSDRDSRFQVQLAENEIFTLMQVTALEEIIQTEVLVYNGKHYELVAESVEVGLRDNDFVEALWKRKEVQPNGN